MNEHLSANLLPDNQIINFILLKLYNLQILTIELFNWNLLTQDTENKEKHQQSYYVSLLRWHETISELQNDLRSNAKFQTNDPDLLQFKSSISLYLAKLNDWGKHAENYKEKTIPKNSEQFV